MKLTLIKELEVIEKKRAIQLEYDLEVYKERLCNLAYEYYLGNKDRFESLIILRTGFNKYKINDEIVKLTLRDSFEYAFNMLEKEMRKQSSTIV